jgi:hypothetical protein
MYNCAICHEFPYTELLILSRNMTYLDACEEFAVLRMYNERLAFMDYKAINTVRSKIRWDDLARKYACKKKFTRVLDRLKNTGLVDYHSSLISHEGIRVFVYKSRRSVDRQIYFLKGF